MLFITIIYILMLLLLKIHMNKQSAKRRLDSKTLSEMFIFSAAGRFCWRISYSISIYNDQGVQKSASKGNADAIGQIGVMYVNGEYVKKDEFKGIQLIRYSNDMEKIL